MKLAARLPRRLSLLACASLVALALILPACGSSDTPASAGETTTRESTPAGKRVVAGNCQAQLGGFLGSLDTLRRNLAVGLDYESYVAEVHRLRATYAGLPVERLEIDCLLDSGTPGERAFNQYIAAANEWGGCLSEASCSSTSIESELQAKWQVASSFLSAAHRGLRETPSPK